LIELVGESKLQLAIGYHNFSEGFKSKDMLEVSVLLK
jgi:hypothetical protein